MSEKARRNHRKWAQFRFSIIGGLLASPPRKGELRQEIEKLATRLYRHPSKDKWVKVSESSIERWYYQAKNAKDPIKALTRKKRSDCGKTYAMTPVQLQALQWQYKMYPHWSYQLHADNLAALIEQNPHLGAMPSYATVRRRMTERNWYKKPLPRTPGQKVAAERLENLEVRGFESEYFNGLWHLDFHQTNLKVIDVNGQWYTPHALSIMDDCSRVCCHIQWYLQETAESLNHGLLQAFAKRGLPRELMTDNGSAMIAGEIEEGLSNIGILHNKTLPYSPYQNGKQEAFWAQVEGRMMAMLTHVKPLTLKFLNDATQAWAEMEYNRTFHDEIRSTPLDKMLHSPDVSRPAPELDELRFAFAIEEKRTQRKSDGTVSIKGVRFEIPSRFRFFKKLAVRYQSWDLSSAYLVDEQGQKPLARIYPQDKIKNSNKQRRKLRPLDQDVSNAFMEQTNDCDPVPPLLRKLMADYAATGLPPAYIPQNNKQRKEKENG